MPDYQYQPVLGVEPYKANGVPLANAFGGGADVTNDNLLISLWAVTALTDGTPTAGQLVKPFRNTSWGAAQLAAADTAVATDSAKGYGSVFSSRYASRFFLIQGDEGSVLPDFLFAVLQPPQDFKNLIQNSFKSVVLDPDKTLGVNVTIQGPILLNFCWKFEAENADQTPRPETCTFSGGAVQYYKTDGSDGVFPQPFLTNTPENRLEYYKKTIEGDFYVGAYFSIDDNAGAGFFNIYWPGSNARR